MSKVRREKHQSLVKFQKYSKLLNKSYKIDKHWKTLLKELYRP